MQMFKVGDKVKISHLTNDLDDFTEDEINFHVVIWR